MGIFLYYFVYFYLDQIVYFYFSIIKVKRKIGSVRPIEGENVGSWKSASNLEEMWYNK